MSKTTVSLFREVSALLLATGLVLTCVPYADGQQPAPQWPGSATNASTPVKTPETEQAVAKFAQLAQPQGRAESAVLDWVLANSGALKGDMRAGELRVAFTITQAEGWWDKAGGGKLAWHEPPTNSMHLRIFVADAVDGRLLPGLRLRATLTDANGNEQSVPTDFGWYPLINAYGGNLALDADSNYTLRVTVDPLLPENRFAEGDRFTHATVAEFPAVTILRDALAQLPLATNAAFNNEVELLKPCNSTLSAAITSLWQHSAAGAEQASNDYFIGYALDPASLAPPNPEAKLYVWNKLHLTGMEDTRVVIFPRDARTGRLIPGLKPYVSIVAADGVQYGPGELPWTSHPWFNHYGHSARLPRKGAYKLHVRFEAPGFRRWGRQSERFASAVDIAFDNVALQDEPTKDEPAKNESGQDNNKKDEARN